MSGNNPFVAVGGLVVVVVVTTRLRTRELRRRLAALTAADRG
jgi:hypothetical protein